MWNSLGALRDRVRENANAVRENAKALGENAKAAAQVAQGVLIAAAAEDDDSAYPADPSARTDDQQQWDSSDQQEQKDGLTGGFFAPPQQDDAAGPPPPPPPPSGNAALEPPPPPPDAPPPPPPPEGAFGDLLRAVPAKPTRTRATRYVEAGLVQAKIPTATPLRPTVALFQPPPSGEFANDMGVLAPSEQAADAGPPPPPEQPLAEQRPMETEGEAAVWGDNWSVPATAQDANDNGQAEQPAFGWGEPAIEQPAEKQQEMDGTAAGEAQSHVFGWGEPAAEQPDEEQNVTGSAVLGEGQNQAFAWGEPSGEAAEADTAPKQSDHDNNMSGLAAEQLETTTEPAPEAAGEWDDKAGDNWNVPTQDQMGDNADWDIPVQESTSADADAWNVPVQDAAIAEAGDWNFRAQDEAKGEAEAWNVPPQDEANAGAEAWNVPAQDEAKADAEAWNIPAQDETKEDAEAWNVPAQDETEVDAGLWDVPVQDEEKADTDAWNIPVQEQAGNADGSSPEDKNEVAIGDGDPIPPALDAASGEPQPMLPANTNNTGGEGNEWNIPDAQPDGNENTAVVDEAWKFNQAISTGNAAEPFAGAQSDAGQSSANDTAIDWFSGQSVQPETSDPTQSEVSASEDLFGSNTDSNQQTEEQITLPAPEPTNFAVEEWSLAGPQANLDSSVSDSTAADGNANGTLFADQVNDSGDRELNQNPDPVTPQPFGMGVSDGNSDSFWSVNRNLGNSASPTPAINAGVTPVIPPPVVASGSTDTFTSMAHEAAESAAVIAKLQEEIQNLTLERDSAAMAQEASDRSIDDLKRSMDELKDDLVLRSENFKAIAVERDDLLRQRDQFAHEKLQAERECDAAVEQGGEGIREARGVIEVMRSGQDVAEKREAIISEQIQALRNDLDRISGERNSLLEESDELKSRLQEMESDSRLREEELRQQLRIAENEKEIAQLEREKAMAASQLHIQEHKELLEAEQSNASSLASEQSRVRELENSIESLNRERDEELFRIEAFSSQMEDMKERTRSVIEERNVFYDQKLELQKEAESFAVREEQVKRALLDAKREQTSLSSERDESMQRYATLRDQLKDTSKQLEAVASERDRLLQERTATATGPSALSEKEKSLAEESRHKTTQVAALQRKLSAAAAKIEKLTVQRGTFQRQRDEAGARLRAAGSEFAMLNGKLQSATEARDVLQKELVAMRDDRDKSLAQVQELSEIATQKVVVDENLDATVKQLGCVQDDLANTRVEITKLSESRSALQQKWTNLVTDMNRIDGQFEVAARERDMLQSQVDALEIEKKSMQQTVKEHHNAVTEGAKKQKSLEAELSTTKERSALDIGIAKAELVAEEKIRLEQTEKLNEVQAKVEKQRSTIAKVREAVVSSLRSGKHELEKDGNILTNSLAWPVIDTIIELDDMDKHAVDIVSSASEVLVNLCTEAVKYANDSESLRVQNAECLQKLEAVHADEAERAAKEEEVAHAKATSDQIAKELAVLREQKRALDIHCQTLEESLAVSESRILALDTQLRDVTQQMRDELDRGVQKTSEERTRLSEEIEKVTTNVKSIWGMLQKSLVSQQIEMYTDDVGDYDEMLEAENVAVLALRATASIVAELERNRAASEEIAQRLATAESEVVRLVDRAEIAEQERDAYKGTNERLERKANTAFAEGEEAAKSRLEAGITNMEDDLEDTREELRQVSEKAARSEKEAGELRALCSKLTAQFNGRTNELDEAEEKVVYLQDQVTNLEEDLEEAHRRLKVLEEESTQARKSDVDRLTSELQEAIQQVETLEKECSKLREAYDIAENSARESELLAETHRRAEENLQIAIEQLEAAQDSAVEQRTIALRKKVEDAEGRCVKALKREEGLAMTENKLSIRDEEIKELRGVIGRLADERVELKLELEKSLSRLNHPDAGGQLVDRRVVRQLLVSYFRVGSIRRRDVLELMSRMLAFSDAENVAVGLKRRALMDRIGSLVQPPELDDASLPPLGTVSDKWIEFLMNETEEGEEQAKGW